MLYYQMLNQAYTQTSNLVKVVMNSFKLPHENYELNIYQHLTEDLLINLFNKSTYDMISIITAQESMAAHQ